MQKGDGRAAEECLPAELVSGGWSTLSGTHFPVKDEVMVTLDTSGDSLHKRGYRLMTSKAPLTETLAAALIMLTPWKKDRILVDPFCGSGTFPIEAAMIAANIAPGMNRQFTAEQWKNLIPKQLWYDTVEEAQDLMDADIQVDIQGYDIDAEVVKAARENAKRAGVDHLIHFQQRAVADLHHPKNMGLSLQIRRMESASRRKRIFRSCIRRSDRLMQDLTAGHCI